MQKHSEIVILGSGLIGLSTALLLEKDGIESIIIDKSPINLLKSNKDRRTTAISQGSARIYEKIGVWKDLNEVHHFCQLHSKGYKEAWRNH